MLRINAKDSSAAVQKYLFGHERADYYTEDSEIIGNWGGKGAARLGLSGTVDPVAFGALCDNLHPVTGEQLTPRMKANRTVGWDMTFDVPKSVSVLYGLSGSELLMEAFRRSISRTMDYVEKDVQTRVRLDGKSDEVRGTDGLTWGEFLHLTTRPVDGTPDPQLHAHIFVLNSTFDSQEQRWKAAMFRQIVENAPDFQATFHSLLVEELRAIGLSITYKGIAFEVDGVPESANVRFSRRTDVIEAEAIRRGITDPVEKAKLGAQTREPKNSDYSPHQLMDLWIARTPTSELQAIRSVLARIRGPIPALQEHLGVHREPVKVREASEGRQGEEAKVILANERVGGRQEIVTGLGLTGRATRNGPSLPSVPATERENAAITKLTPEQQEAIRLATVHCFTNESVVPQRHFRAAVLRFGIEDVRVHEVDGMVDSLPDLVRKEVNGRRMVTTKDIIAEEKKMADWVRAGKGTMQPLAHGHIVKDARLGQDQRDAVYHVLESRDRVTGVEGRAGTGKTTLMKETIDAIEANGTRVVVLAPTAAASREILRNDGFKEADTVEKWLVDEKWRSTVGKGEALWIDEAGLLSSRDMVRLIELAEKRGSRLILSGDTRQHRAVMRGDIMRTLKTHADLSLAVVHTVRRQEGIYKEAVEAFSEGYLDKGFEKLDDMGAILELPNGQRYKAIAVQYMQAQKDQTKLQIVAPTHSEIRKVTTAIRDELMAAGKLKEKEQEAVEVYRPLYMNDAEKTDLRSFEPGQAVVMKKSAPGLMPGDRLTIVATGRELLTVKTEDGRQRKFDPSRIAERFDVYAPYMIGIAPGDKIVMTKGGHGQSGERINNGSLHTVDGFTVSGDIRLENGLIIPRDFKHFSHGYATTSYVAQGKTAHMVIVAESSESFPAGSREQWYVSISRGMKYVIVYTDDREELLDAVQRSSQRMAALDLEQGIAPEPTITTSPPERKVEPPAMKELLGEIPADVPIAKLQAMVPQPKQPPKLQEKLGNVPRAAEVQHLQAKKSVRQPRMVPLVFQQGRNAQTYVPPPPRTIELSRKSLIPARIEKARSRETIRQQERAVDREPELNMEP